MTRLSRFLHLERDRGTASPEERASPASESSVAGADSAGAGAGADLGAPSPRANRFGALEMQREPPSPAPRPSSPSAAPATASGHLARFDKPDDSNVTIDEKNEADQPFVRCMRCEGDNTRYARHCVHCHGDLETAEQRAFNEQLWAERRALRDQERAAHHEAREAQLKAAWEAGAEARKAHEELARKVAVEMKQRLGETTLLALFGLHRRGRWWVYEASLYLLIAAALVGVLAFLGGWAIVKWTAPIIVIAAALMALKARLLK